MATEMGVEDILGLKVFELKAVFLNNKSFDEEFCREQLNTIIGKHKRKEEIELVERKRKEEMELVERNRKEELQLEERVRKAELKIAERKRRDEMDFELQKKRIKLKGGHFARAC
ncbi:hypothetical protein TNCV_3222271 [Trichonephila clavipes]|nr:hypothetical protein TNCV_3222271 [Trichonephila clavipes]